MTFDINAYFAKVKAQSQRLQPYSDGAYYLMSLDKEEAGTIAGRIFKLANPQVVAGHIVNGTHREATIPEIETWNSEQGEKRLREQAEQLAKRQPLVINAPYWRQGEPLPTEVAASVAAHSAAAKRQAPREPTPAQ